MTMVTPGNPKENSIDPNTIPWFDMFIGYSPNIDVQSRIVVYPAWGIGYFTTCPVSWSWMQT